MTDYNNIRFKYNEPFVVTTDAPATEYSLTNGNVTETNNGNGTYSYSFTPFPRSTAPTFTLKVSNTVNLTTDVDDPNCITNFLVNGVELEKPVKGTKKYELPKGANVKMYVTQEAIACTFNDNNVPFVEVSDIPGCAGYYELTTNSSGTFYAKFSNVEPAARFTVYLNVDRSGAVVAQSSDDYHWDLTAGTNEVSAPEDGYITVTPVAPYAFTKFLDTTENFGFMTYDNIQTSEVRITKTVVKEFSGSLTGNDSYDTAGHSFSIETLDQNKIRSFDFTIKVVDSPDNIIFTVGGGESVNSANNRKIEDLITGNNERKYTEYDKYFVISSENSSLYSVKCNGEEIQGNGTPKVFKIGIDQVNRPDYLIEITANTPFVGDNSFTFNVNNLNAINRLKFFEDESDMLGTDIVLSSLNNGENNIPFNVGNRFRVFPQSGYTFTTFTQNSSPIERDDFGVYDFTPANNDVITLVAEKEVIIDNRPTFRLVTDKPGRITEVLNFSTDETYEVTEQETIIHFSIGNDIRITCSDTPLITYLNTEETVFDAIGSSYRFQHLNDGDVVRIFFEEEIEPTFVLYVDDASKVSSFTNIVQNESYTLHNGENRIPYNDENDIFALYPLPNVYISSANVDGDETKVSYNKKNHFYRVNDVKENSRVEFVFAAPPVITVTFVNSGTEEFLRFAQINDIDCSVDEFRAGKTISNGDQLWLSYDKDKYIINSITINGVAVQNITGVIFYEHVYEDLNIVFDVIKPDVINYSIVTEHPERIVVSYYGKQGNNKVELDTPDEDNLKRYSFSTTSLYPQIVIEKPVAEGEVVTDHYFTEIKDNANNVYELGELITLTDGMVISVNFTKVVDNETFHVFFHGDYVDATLVSANARVTTLAEKKHHEVKFNSAYDGDFRFSVKRAFAGGGEGDDNEGYVNYYDHVYLNGDKVEQDLESLGMYYTITPKDNDIVRVYTGVEENVEPASYPVEISIYSELLSEILILRENVQVVSNETSSSEELQGTTYNVFVKNESAAWLLVEPLKGAEAYTLHKAPAKIDGTNEFPADQLPEGYKHVYSFTVNQPLALSITKSLDGSTTGVDGITSELAPADSKVYNLQGIVVKGCADNLESLPAGVYIVNGHKVLVK